MGDYAFDPLLDYIDLSSENSKTACLFLSARF
jgi:hypothetical protein